MIAKPGGWTMGGSIRPIDAVESGSHLGPDEVIVRIDPRKADHPDLDGPSGCDSPTHGSQDVCRGVGGHVIEAGANALWYVDRSVIVPVGAMCGNCVAGQRDRAATSSDAEPTANDDDGTPEKLVIVRADELCVMSVSTDWRKPRST